MGLADGPCELTGEPGILDETAGYRCACVSPLMGIFCDGTIKNAELWKDYRGGPRGTPLPEMPPGARSLSEVIAEVLE